MIKKTTTTKLSASIIIIPLIFFSRIFFDISDKFNSAIVSYLNELFSNFNGETLEAYVLMSLETNYRCILQKWYCYVKAMPAFVIKLYRTLWRYSKKYHALNWNSNISKKWCKWWGLWAQRNTLDPNVFYIAFEFTKFFFSFVIPPRWCFCSVHH